MVEEETIKAYSNLGAGDIIRFSKNYNGEIKNIEVSYDYRENSDGVITNKTCGNAANTYLGYMMSIGDEGFRIVTPGKVTNGGTIEQQFYTPDVLMNKIKTPGASAQNIKEYSSMIRTYISGDGYPVVIVDTSRRKLTFTEASLDDVFAYEDTSSKYDTVVVMTHFYVGRMGTVVYR